MGSTKKVLMKDSVSMDRKGMLRQEGDDFEVFKKEVLARKSDCKITQMAEGCRYDAVVDGNVLVEFKRRNYRSDQFKEYWINTQKVNFLRRSTIKGKKCFIALFFSDKWFMVPVTDDETEFKYLGWKKVDNPMNGYSSEENYGIRADQGKFYEYKC